MVDPDKLRVNASPTKEFFIYMLTRDVQLSRAIIDLVDNCVDGAHRLRGEDRYDGLWVRIQLTRDTFHISDNCGGIPIQIARDYAFRFGRPKEAAETPNSVGLFGVGMKRTFFKLGRFFSVESVCRTERFTIKVDVDKWMASGDRHGPDDWHFDFEELDEQAPEVPEGETGTAIEVRSLLPAVSDTFALDNFQQQLILEITTAHAQSVDRGLAITINQIPVTFVPQKLLRSDLLQPAFVERVYPREALDGVAGDPVRVKLFAGLAERSYHDGGWYVFCNGRLIVKADKGPTTVWGEVHNMRQYHPDFAYFRGYAYFDARQPSLLPWTTTKTGVDEDSRLYKIVQREMIEITKPVLAFLTELTKQRSGEDGEAWAESVFRDARAVKTQELPEPTPFRVPSPPPRPPGPIMQRIQYWRPLQDVEKAKRLLNAFSFKQVGEQTFDYFMKYEADN